MQDSTKKLFPIFVKDDFFTPEEEQTIWEGLDTLHQLNLFTDPSKTAAARDLEGNILKQNKGCFLDKLCNLNIEIRNLHSTVQKVFQSAAAEYASLDFWTYPIVETSRNGTLVSYYENEDHYLEHRDKCFFTVLIWFYRKPKAFKGGNLFLHDLNEEIEVKHNRLTIIPSQALHSVSAVKLPKKYLGKRKGRYCISMFLS